MKRFLVAALFSLGLWGSSGGQLFAQIGTYTPPFNIRPPVSPYLNMFRGNPAIDYYGIVQPQLQTSQQLFQLQSTLNQPIAGQPLLGTGVPAQNQLMTTTGHPVMFMNYSYYYPILGGGQGGGGGGGFGGVGGATTGSFFPTVINNNFRR
jgi:hypothetical protein